MNRMGSDRDSEKRCLGGWQVSEEPLSFFFFLAMPKGTWDLPQPEMEPTAPAVEAQS